LKIVKSTLNVINANFLFIGSSRQVVVKQNKWFTDSRHPQFIASARSKIIPITRHIECLFFIMVLL